MCGIVAVDIKEISSSQIEEVKRVLKETEIRGRHSSGISWFSNGEVHTIKRPVPVTDLLEDFDIERCVAENDGHLKMIAHIRYSTSNSEFNQPITEPILEDGELIYDYEGSPGNFALVHNGVVSQQPPDNWHDEFGLGFTAGKNDSELIYLAFSNDDHPLEKFPDASMAVAYINPRGVVKVFRDGKRPLWITRLYNGFIATSTEDIIKRAEVVNRDCLMAKAGVEYDLTRDEREIIVEDIKDLQ